MRGERDDVLGDRCADLGGDRPAFEQSRGAGRGVGHAGPVRLERFARVRSRDGLAGLRREVVDRGEELRDPRGHLALELRVADRRQVDEHVGRGSPGGRLGEQRGDVEVARGVRVAAAGQGLGDAERARGTPRRRRAAPRRRGGRRPAWRPSARRSRPSVSRGSFSAAANPANAAASSSARARNRSDRRRPVRSPTPGSLVLGELGLAGRQRRDHRDEARPERRGDGRRAAAAGHGLGRRETRDELVERQVAEATRTSSGMHRAIVGCRLATFARRSAAMPTW